MLDNRRAELTTTMLVTIALGMLVLILSIVFFTGIFTDGRQTVRDCENQGGFCSDQPCAQRNLLHIRIGTCETGYCCMREAAQ